MDGESDGGEGRKDVGAFCSVVEIVHVLVEAYSFMSYVLRTGERCAYELGRNTLKSQPLDPCYILREDGADPAVGDAWAAGEV